MDGLVEASLQFNGRPAERKYLGTYNIRFEGVDALETHYLNRHEN